MEVNYNNADFRRPDPGDPVTALERVDIQPQLRVGMAAPDFDLQSLGAPPPDPQELLGPPPPDHRGGRVRLSDVLRDRHAVLVFGAITSPVTATNLPELNHVWEYFKWRGVQFLFVYAREPHPGEAYPRHTSMDQKIAAAKELQRIEEIRFPVLVDDVDGTIHRAYGARPNPVFVVHRNGRLVYRAGHAEAGPLREYLEHLLLWDQVQEQNLPTHNMYMEQIRFIIPDGPLHKQIVRRAGPKAVREMEGAFGEHSHLT